MAKSVIIIGAGIAGLAAGCYAQMNGFKSKMFEMHNKPGGLCTAWKRKGYTFDLCVHWITGSSPKSNVYDIWEELGIVQGRDFITHEYGIKVIDEEGNEFVTYTNPDKLQEEMLTFSKEDEKLIKNFTKDIKKLGSMDLPIDMGFLDILRMLPSLRLWKKYSLPLSEMAAKFKNPTLRKLFEMAFYWHDQTTAFCTMEIAQMGGGYSGYPIGGSLPVAKAIEQRYLDLGGEISYKSQVKRILVEENRAVGIELSDGTKERGDIIISAADGHSTIFNWLNGEYIDDKIRSFYDSLELFPPIVFISLGVNQDYSHEPHVLSFSLKKPITITGNEIDHIVLRNHSFDPTLAPEGKTAFTIILETNYDYWVGLNDEEYLAEKKNI
ncbi:MAG: FAD-dependent oxidoreductase, partial [Methanobacterium sp.]|nr:FAD-dependent oxidoreductase [Methanobacterium sp.]